MIAELILTSMLSIEEPKIETRRRGMFKIVKMCIIEYTFNGYKDDVPEARRRGNKGSKKRRRGGNGLR